MTGGTPFLVRTGEARDALQLLENGKLFVRDGQGQVMVPGELDLTEDDEIKWVENHRERPANLLLVAEAGGKLIGHIDFSGASRVRLRHTGHFGLGVRPECRGKGVGRALVSHLIDWAMRHPVIEKINLQVLSGNHRAIALYRSLGFMECGRRHGEIKLAPDRYLDDVSMELRLK